MKYYAKLKGERIFLAPVRIEDADIFCQWINDPRAALYTTLFEKQYNLNKEEEVLRELVKNNCQIFSIVQNDTEELIGSCSLFDIDNLDRKAELGIMIGDKKSWNQKLGREAVELLLDYGFNILNLNNIYLKVFDYNKRAITCYQKAGFKICGRHRQAHIVMGNKYDEITMDILAEEFTASRLKKTFAAL